MACSLAGPLSAQELAPVSLENTLYLTTPAKSAELFNYTESAILSSGTRTPVNVSGMTQTLPSGTYGWSKTGAATGTLTWVTNARTARMDITFTAAGTGTYSETLSDHPAPIVGNISFSSLPLDPTPPLVNLSVRTTLVAGQPAIAGFVVSGTTPRRVLVRAVGPTLAQFGSTNFAANPSLAVFKGSGQIATNNGWGGDASLAAVFASVGAFALPATSRDCALVLTLDPGDYTAQVRGDGGTEVLTEVYLIDK
jgi:hypothetical protein